MDQHYTANSSQQLNPIVYNNVAYFSSLNTSFWDTWRPWRWEMRCVPVCVPCRPPSFFGKRGGFSWWHSATGSLFSAKFWTSVLQHKLFPYRDHIQTSFLLLRAFVWFGFAKHWASTSKPSRTLICLHLSKLGHRMRSTKIRGAYSICLYNGK